MRASGQVLRHVGTLVVAAATISVALAATTDARAMTEDVESAVAAAAIAVRDAFGGDADVTIARPVLSLARGAVLPVTRAVVQPGSRTGGVVRFVLYGDRHGVITRVGRLTADVRVRADHVRTARPLAARAPVAIDDLVNVRDDIGRQALAALPRAEHLVGATTRRAIAAGEVVSAMVVAVPELVTSGDEVATVARVGALEVHGRAVAAQSGGLGETVVVVNPDSRRRLRGRVVAAGRVEVLHGS